MTPPRASSLAATRRWWRVGGAVGLVVVLVAGVVGYVAWPRHAAVAYPCPDDSQSAQPQWAPASLAFDASYEQHPFVGNGYLGLRIPPAGMGYLQTGERSGWPLYTPRYDGAFAAGLYGAQPGLAEGRQVVAALPNWSTLLVGVGGDTYSPTTPPGQVSHFRQTEFWRCGLVRTELTWTAKDGRATDLVYDVIADRSDRHAAAVHLTAVPHFTGHLTVTSRMDPTAARRLDPLGVDASDPTAVAVEYQTRTSGEQPPVVLPPPGTQQRDLAANPVPRTEQVVSGVPPVRVDVAAVLHSPAAVSHRGADLVTRLAVRPETSYEVTAFVGVDTTLTALDPRHAALDTAGRAAKLGWPRELAQQARSWRDLWAADVEVPGRPDMQRWVRAALYSMYSGTAADTDTSINPTGWSSDNYGGLIFWDADTWMFPGLLELAPRLARSLVDYRFKTLPAALDNARRLGYRGAFYPWTSAGTGALATDCHSWSPPHCLTQIHLQGDIALAVWQYFQATDDITYLRQRAWPVLAGIAQFWASRVTPNSDGSFSIRDVAGPDEYSNGVDDGVYTNAVAAMSLRAAIDAAGIVGMPVTPQWARIADHLRMPFDPGDDIFLQYAGYVGRQIKQADAVMLEYPLQWPMPLAVATRTLDFYSERSDPDGPAMTDSIHAIDAAGIGEAGCAVGTYLDRSVRPFVRDPFGQFNEGRGGKVSVDPQAGAPAFDFVTLAGGFVQEFTNGLVGLRWRPDAVWLNPLLPPQLSADVTVRGLHWRGRIFDVAIGPAHTLVTLRSGPPMAVLTPGGPHTLGYGHPLQLITRRPDLAPTDNAARCAPAAADSEQPGDYAEAAVDGDPATSWRANSAQAAVTVDLGAPAHVTGVRPHWSDLAPAKFQVAVSVDGHDWQLVSTAADGRLPAPVPARFVRVEVSGAHPDSRPGISELEVSTAPP